MATDRFQRVKQIFNQLADLPPDARAARLDTACGGDLEDALTYPDRAVEHTRRDFGEESED